MVSGGYVAQDGLDDGPNDRLRVVIGVRPAGDAVPEGVAEDRHVVAEISGPSVMGTLVQCTYEAIIEGATGTVSYSWEWNEQPYGGNTASILSPTYLESDVALVEVVVEDDVSQDYDGYPVFIESAWAGECNP